MAMETAFLLRCRKLNYQALRIHRMLLKAPHYDAKHLMMMMDLMHITPQDAIDAQPNLVHLNIFDGQLCKRILVD